LLLGLAAVTLLATSSALAASGIVQTLQGRLEGPLQLRHSEVQIGTNTVPWSTVLYLLFDPDVRTLPRPHKVRFHNGESWRADILRLAGGRLALDFELFGPREIPCAGVAALDFTPGTQRDRADTPGHLYLKDGELVPGNLLWLDAAQLALDSPLGVLTLPRERLACYVFPDHARLADVVRNADEVRLVDGSILQGGLRVEHDRLVLRHAGLGNRTDSETRPLAPARVNPLANGRDSVKDDSLTIPLAWVRSLIKAQPAAHLLGRQAPAAAQSVGPLGATNLADAFVVLRLDAPEVPRRESLTQLQVHAHTMLTYRLPDALARGSRFHATVQPLPGARGSAWLRLLAGTNVVAERELQPADAPQALATTLPATRELTVIVDWGRRLGFPCGAVLSDPLLAATASADSTTTGGSP
jgi:hypothetical protein